MLCSAREEIRIDDGWPLLDLAVTLACLVSMSLLCKLQIGPMPNPVSAIVSMRARSRRLRSLACRSVSGFTLSESAYSSSRSISWMQMDGLDIVSGWIKSLRSFSSLRISISDNLSSLRYRQKSHTMFRNWAWFKSSPKKSKQDFTN